MNSEQEGSYLFKPAQFFGPPPVFPPPAQGKLQAAVRFIIHGLCIGSSQKESLKRLARKCGMELWDTHIQRVRNQKTQKEATLFTLAFYVSIVNESQKQQTVAYAGRLLAERFLGLLSFYAGMKLSMVHLQATFWEKGQYSSILPPVGRSDMPPLPVEFRTALIEKTDVPDDIFSALFWLRRGLAERDSVETFSSLMVCLQIMARHIVIQQPVVRYCQACGAQCEIQQPSITSLMRELIVSRLSATPELFDKLWRARNAITAHGNLPVTPAVLLELTELKFDVAILAYKSIKLGLGMPLEKPPLPNRAFFITDAFMHSD